MSRSNLEILPNEVVASIFEYCGDVTSIMQSFLGLNERFNHLVLDQHLHLLTNYLSLKPLKKYYDSTEFQQVICQLLTVNTSLNEEKLIEILRPLIGYGLRQRYFEVTERFQLLRKKFECVRQTMSEDELKQVDEEIKKAFSPLNDRHVIVTANVLERIEELIFTYGARLVCRNGPGWDIFNLASLIQKGHSYRFQLYDAKNFEMNLKLLVKMTEFLIVSNPDLLNNKLELSDKPCKIESFVFHYIFGSRHYYKNAYARQYVLNHRLIRVILDLLFLIFNCCTTTIDEQKHVLITMLERLNDIQTEPNEFYRQALKNEIIKFTLEHYSAAADLLNNQDISISGLVESLVRETQFSMIEYLLHQSFIQNYFRNEVDIRLWLKKTLGTGAGRQLFDGILDKPIANSLFSKRKLFFALLDLREQKFLERMLIISPDLINELDDEGNDPLLYMTQQKYTRYYHRIVELLLKYGCDPQRKNIHGQTFQDLLRLPQNLNLLNDLIRYNIYSF